MKLDEFVAWAKVKFQALGKLTDEELEAEAREYADRVVGEGPKKSDDETVEAMIEDVKQAALQGITIKKKADGKLVMELPIVDLDEDNKPIHEKTESQKEGWNPFISGPAKQDADEKQRNPFISRDIMPNLPDVKHERKVEPPDHRNPFITVDQEFLDKAERLSQWLEQKEKDKGKKSFTESDPRFECETEDGVKVCRRKNEKKK
jgi:hypothetical protein